MRRVVMPLVAVVPMTLSAVIHGALVMPERHALPRRDRRHALKRHNQRDYDDKERSSKVLHSGSDVTASMTFDQTGATRFLRQGFAGH